jgi:hypothetical protein
VVKRALEQPVGPSTPGEATQLPGFPASDRAERRWPLRRRVVFIVIGATLCWAIPATVAYILFRVM